MPPKPIIAQSSAMWLYQLIGAPLNALVKAEAQAASTTAEFIERYGFNPPEDPGASEAGELGELRMARFSHRREGPDGPTSVQVEAPFLSLVPIPALQIRDAELEFFIKIVQTQRRGGTQSAPVEEDAQPESPGGRTQTFGFEPPERVDFQAMMASPPHTGRVNARQSLDMQIKMKIRVEQADLPAGLGRLLNVMEQNVAVTEKPALETISEGNE